MPIHHFLVPLDLGEMSQLQLAYATALGSKLQAHLTLLHVIHIPHLAETELGSYMETINSHAQQAIDNLLKGPIDAGLKVASLLVHGTPWQEIVRAAKAKDINLIIVGTHSRRGVRHALLGSVAEKIVRLAPCSVLVIPNTALET
jgi:nucleotide-binding universal stress UspA family protein